LADSAAESSKETGTEPARGKIPARVQWAVYISGYLSTSMQNMAGLLIPLWVVVTLNPSPFVIGIILGARHFLPTLLSIHGGAMMDHLGAKRVMLVFAVVGILVHLLYPLTPWIWAVLILQLLGGLSTTMSWMGAQTLIGQVMKGDATHSGRLGSAALIGNLTVPPIIGAAWDILGTWGAFLTMALWAVVVRISILRNSTYAVRGSFYVVYLDSINLTGTEIGFMMSAAGALGAGAALMVGRITQVIKPVNLLFATVAGTVIFISLPPLTDAFWLLIFIASLWGACAGMSMPLMFSIMSKSADSQSQGKGVGLRITANRMGATVLPIIMGAVADIWGIGNSFYIMGAALLIGLAGIGLYARRVSSIRD
jgi:MFS family permease